MLLFLSGVIVGASGLLFVAYWMAKPEKPKAERA